jgi:hypothetical protein
MNYINSVKDYLRLATAREFWQSNLAQGPFAYEKNAIEKMGDILVWPLFKNSDRFLRRIREPYMIMAMTVSAIGISTLLFYPEESIKTLNSIIPISAVLEPKVVKFIMFLASEATIFGFGARTYGRLSNNSLMTAWNNKNIVAVPVGAVIPQQHR